ncbi:MAG TPA: hypothetical protein VFR34_15885 [Paracoccaceae bacterium]|nr:hypothetical protein [Paracoccaceae bacterium]
MKCREHFRVPRRETPFHPRVAAASLLSDWYAWSGFKAARALWDEELEYFCIRSTAALLDISPLVKYRIEGPGAAAYLNRLTPRDVTGLAPGRVQYTSWCDDDGQVLDDGTLFRLGPERFRLCCQERHLPWLVDSAFGFEVAVADESEAVAALALQGPTSAAVLRALGVAEVEELRPFDCADTVVGGVPVLLSRTGFSGDLGYELFVAPERALALWDALEGGRCRAGPAAHRLCGDGPGADRGGPPGGGGRVPRRGPGAAVGSGAAAGRDRVGLDG